MTNPAGEFTLQDDLHILKLMTNRIDSYVRGDEIYGNQGMFVSGHPAVTVGGVLLRIRRLNALREFLTKSEQAELDATILQHDNTYQDWSSHYESKLLAEANSRTDRIIQFINEYEEDSSQYEVAFEPEQTRRTIIQEMLYMMKRINLEDASLTAKLKEIDEALVSLVEPSEFQWADALKTVYSPDEFWWLYSSLKSED